jgi:hypothetical protein
VAKGSFLLLPVVLVSAIDSAQVLEEVSREPKSDFKAALGGSPLTCFQPPTLVAPAQVAERARLKTRLLILSQDSLYDDAKGIINIAPEKEIRKLANKLKTNRIE